MTKYTSLLTEVGLTMAQAEAYEILTTHGEMTAGRLRRLSSLERGMVYVALKQLIELGLIDKREHEGKPDRFSAHHPSELEKLVDTKVHEADVARASFESVAHQLKVEYETRAGQPGVRFHVGIEGLQKLYNDINSAGIDCIYLIRSSQFETSGEAIAVVNKQVKKQIELGINVKIITPLLPETAHYLSLDDIYKNTERRIIPREVFNTSSQILIYANKIAITTYRDPLLTTIIDHKDVTDTFLAMFNYIWRASAQESDDIVKRLRKSGTETPQK